MGSISKVLTIAMVLIIAISSLILIGSVPVGLAQSVNAPPNFTISIVASINGYSSTCVFGINQDAGTTYSSKYDSLAENYPSTGVHSWFFHYNSSYKKAEQKLKTYIVPSNGSTVWHLNVINIDQVGTITLTWDNTNFASMTLRDGVLRNVLADMNKVSNFSYAVTGWATVSEFDIVYNWSGAMTPTPIPTSAPTTNPTPTITNSPTGYSDWNLTVAVITVIVAILAVVVVAGLLVYLKKRKR